MSARSATAWRVSLLVPLALGVACGSSSMDADMGDNVIVPCQQTDASTAAQPFMIGADGTASRFLCPAGRIDWYTITLAGTDDLIDVDVGFPGPRPTRVALQAQLYDSTGTMAIPNGGLLDSVPGDGVSHLVSTLSAPAGTYLLQISSADPMQFETAQSYVLKLGTATDPDTHEPNDTAATAKPTDALPGFFSYNGDVDDYSITMTAGKILDLTLSNQAGSMPSAEFTILDPDGMTFAQNMVVPGMSHEERRAIKKSGTYVVALTPSAGAPPERASTTGYTLGLSSKDDPDPNDVPPRNDTAATATSLGTYSGSVLTVSNGGYIASLADQDYFRIDVGALTTTAVVETTLAFDGTSMVDPSISLIVPDPFSPCTSDGDCAAVALAATPFECTKDTDCELSHSCLQMGTYKQCPSGSPMCRLCAGAGACLPYTTGSVCGVLEAAAPKPSDPPTTAMGGKKTIHLVQPIFEAGPHFLLVRDAMDQHVDFTNPYTLDVKVSPEPDAGDQSLTATMRNNYYNPLYNPDPMLNLYSTLDRNPDRAIDITTQINGNTNVSGYVSYQNDEDWYKFTIPAACVATGTVCGLQFSFTQPASPTGMVGAYFLRTSDTTQREAWGGIAAAGTYSFGTTNVFNDCSFIVGNGNAAEVYYIQVRSPDGSGWDVVNPYSFKLAALTVGACPAACSYYNAATAPAMCQGGTATCACYDPAAMKCCH